MCGSIALYSWGEIERMTDDELMAALFDSAEISTPEALAKLGVKIRKSGSSAKAKRKHDRQFIQRPFRYAAQARNDAFHLLGCAAEYRRDIANHPADWTIRSTASVCCRHDLKEGRMADQDARAHGFRLP